MMSMMHNLDQKRPMQLGATGARGFCLQGDSGHCSPVSEVADELGDIKQDGDLWQSGAGKTEADSGDGADSHGKSFHSII